MKKILITMIACLAMVGSVHAQNRLVATLKHGDATTLFYGGSSLQNAHDAAEDGDIITLSEGVFLQAKLAKAVTIRGAGVNSNEENGISETVLQGIIFADSTRGITIEGCEFKNELSIAGDNLAQNLSDITFSKCKLSRFVIDSSNSTISFVNCIGTGNFRIETKSTGTNINIINSVIMSIRTYHDESVFHVRNSIVGCGPEWSTCAVHYCSFENSILLFYLVDWRLYGLPEDATSSNCIALNPYSDVNLLPEGNNNITLPNVSFLNVFKTFAFEYKDDGAGPVYPGDNETFELSDEAASMYLGDDGKQVGVYGGDKPFSLELPYPQITKATVAKKAVDGKLSVNIELNGGN